MVFLDFVVESVCYVEIFVLLLVLSVDGLFLGGVYFVLSVVSMWLSVEM